MPPTTRPPLLTAAAVVLAVAAAVGLGLSVGRDLLPGPARVTSTSGIGQGAGTDAPPPGPLPAAPTGDLPAGQRLLLLGASAPTREAIDRTERDLGRRLGGVRLFRRWGVPLFDQDDRWAADGGRTLFLSVKGRYQDGRVIPFNDIAQARPGSPLYADMAEQARQVIEFRRPVFLTFNHEPDSDPENGGPAAFVAAWRTWVGVLRAEGVRNARFVWTTTAFGYGRGDSRAAPRYWPGDGWTDLIGVDAYNSYRCSNPAGPWMSPEQLLRPVIEFAAGHPRHPVVLMEWSSVEDPAVPGRKGQWFRELVGLLQRPPYRQVVGLLQWGGDVEFVPGGTGCDFHYASSPESVRAFRGLGVDPALGARTLPEPAGP